MALESLEKLWSSMGLQGLGRWGGGAGSTRIIAKYLECNRFVWFLGAGGTRAVVKHHCNSNDLCGFLAGAPEIAA